MTFQNGVHVITVQKCQLKRKTSAAKKYRRADYGPVRRRNEEERFRYLAYRSFVSWCWGYLGRSVRVVIPSCVVNRIRLQFPDPAGQYVGFRPPLD
ncbi:P2X purinoceptor 7-like isoform X3 [Carassius carassius]|uniref:P2X purinoceptor 7-like isoform X3 n=1 Tax=Carassius carassius TaxID=217509 RepID=UPI002869049A|nr:P2X purinoceptor 7-like isoform X3 [Carassius carassius]